MEREEVRRKVEEPLCGGSSKGVSCQLEELPPLPASPGRRPVMPDACRAHAGFRFLMYVSVYNMWYILLYIPLRASERHPSDRHS